MRAGTGLTIQYGIDVLLLKFNFYFDRSTTWLTRDRWYQRDPTQWYHMFIIFLRRMVWERGGCSYIAIIVLDKIRISKISIVIIVLILKIYSSSLGSHYTQYNYLPQFGYDYYEFLPFLAFFFIGRFMLWYLTWRVATGKHEEIGLNFMIAGHTKFAPDGCFGLIKKAYRRNAVSSLAELASVVENRSVVHLWLLKL